MERKAVNMAMAELDGWTHLRYASIGTIQTLWGFKRVHDSPSVWAAGCVGDTIVHEDYYSDLNAVARIVWKLPETVRESYRDWLAGYSERIDASAMERCKAILLATGRWEG